MSSRTSRPASGAQHDIAATAAAQRQSPAGLVDRPGRARRRPAAGEDRERVAPRGSGEAGARHDPGLLPGRRLGGRAAAPRSELDGASVVILGCGHLGTACARMLLKQARLSGLTLVTRRPGTAAAALASVRGAAGATAVAAYSGDVLEPEMLARVGQDGLPERTGSPVHPLPAPADPAGALIERLGADYVIDTVDTATQVVAKAQAHDAGIDRALGALSRGEISGQQAARAIRAHSGRTMDQIVAAFMLPLFEAMTRARTQAYVKVSTVGLAGMGFRLPYTPGQVDALSGSGKLRTKIAAAGIVHQMLWNLAHTSEMRVRLLTPASLVVWGERKEREVTIKGRPLTVQRSGKVKRLGGGKEIEFEPEGDEPLKLALCACGDNTYYGRSELALATSAGQFEGVTREEVALAVLDACRGGTRWDLISALDSASIGPSYLAALERERVLSELAQLEETSALPSITSAGFGPRAAKWLLELTILRAVCPWPELLGLHPARAAERAWAVVRGSDRLRAACLSVGLPILGRDDEYLAGSWAWPCDAAGGTEGRLEEWVNESWVDLRPAAIRAWQARIRSALADFAGQPDPKPEDILSVLLADEGLARTARCLLGRQGARR
jgi:hypothetical protein